MVELSEGASLSLCQHVLLADCLAVIIIIIKKSSIFPILFQHQHY